jgi:hypothetical protein
LTSIRSLRALWQQTSRNLIKLQHTGKTSRLIRSESLILIKSLVHSRATLCFQLTQKKMLSTRETRQWLPWLRPLRQSNWPLLILHTLYASRALVKRGDRAIKNIEMRKFLRASQDTPFQAKRTILWGLQGQGRPHF